MIDAVAVRDNHGFMDAGKNLPLLSVQQRKILAAALTALGVCVLITVGLTLFLLLRGFVLFFSSVLWPLAVAGILAMLVRPVVLWFEDHLKLSRTKSIILLYALGVVLAAGIASFILPVLVSQIIDVGTLIPELLKKGRDYGVEKYPQILAFMRDHLSDEAIQKIGDSLGALSKSLLSFTLPAVQTIGAWIKAVIGLGTGLAIIPVYLFFFLLTKRDLMADLRVHLAFLPEPWLADILFLVQEFASSVVAFFRGQILIGMIMGIVMSLGFTIIGLKFGLIIGIILGLLNIIPYLGTIIGLAVALPVAFFQPEGGGVLVGLVLVVFILTQCLEGYFLTPKIMGKSTGLNPLAIIIAIFFWGVALDGILGMILAIPLTAFFVVLWRLLRQKYLPRHGKTIPSSDCTAAVVNNA
ncbi:MAG: AI-2E family transporter [Verrucomicrobiota bacterium]|nr:AI-2E family transporter [Verrucomicrobiota bacterium]